MRALANHAVPVLLLLAAAGFARADRAGAPGLADGADRAVAPGRATVPAGRTAARAAAKPEAAPAIDSDRVKAAAQDLLRRTVPEGVEARLVAVRLPARIALGEGAYTLEMEPPRGGLRPGIVPLTLVVRRESGTTNRVTAFAEIEMSGPVLVAARDVPRGAALVPGDFTVERRRIPAKGRFLDGPGRIDGLSARAPLRRGQPVAVSAVGRASAVEPGQLVRAVMKTGTVTIEMVTPCRGRGEVGSIVPVLGASGHRLVRARVIAPGRVQVLGSDDTAIAGNVSREERP
jgi:flagella basal body P-ring formation protein FlgA